MTRVVILLAIIALIFASVVEASKENNKYKNKAKCPSFDNLANFTDPAELAKYQRKIMNDLWDTNKTPELTDLGEDLEDVLYDMLGSRVPFWQRYALAVTEWIWVYLPDMDKNLDFCSFADIINATVNFDNNNNCKAILKSINATIDEFQVGGARILDNIVKNAGCEEGYTPIVTLPAKAPQCYKNGFVYNVDEIWDEIGWEYPCALQEAVRALYNSNDKRDKIMALLATAVLSKYVGILETGYEPQLLYKLLAMLTYGKVPKCCCKQLINETKEVAALVGKRNPATFKSARELTGCKIV